MKIAILSITENAYNISKKLKESLDEDLTILSCDLFFKDVKHNINKTFYEYDVLIGIMASGILIRSIAPLIKNKYDDPAVLLIDEKGKFVVSLLSGHLGGANKISLKIAKLLNAQEIITTSTDLNNKFGIDTLANMFYWNIFNKNLILLFNKGILNNEPLKIKANKNIDYLKEYFNNFTLEIDLRNNENNLSKFSFTLNNKEILAEERLIVLGIGCKKNKSKDDILNAINIALNNLNLPIERINLISTASIKKDESGIKEISKELNKKLVIVDIEDIKNFKCKYCSKSKFVKKVFGIDGVCEQSALITAGSESQLIHKKIGINGVTIALAISK